MGFSPRDPRFRLLAAVRVPLRPDATDDFHCSSPCEMAFMLRPEVDLVVYRSSALSPFFSSAYSSCDLIRGQLSRFPAAHAHQMPFALQPLPVQHERKSSIPVSGFKVADWMPGALIPQHDGATAVATLGYCAFERSVFERVVLDVDGKPLVGRVKAGSLGDSPTLQPAVELKPEVAWRTWPTFGLGLSGAAGRTIDRSGCVTRVA
jgi:hypothetical protein